ncbi:MAG: hypothetical protein HYX90_04165 [Chloroflexi bacterium]|nr:hypothetical protein [Chloroflexota bacterium]
MTREEILAMKPGAELNKKVAAEVFAHEVVGDALFGEMERLINPEDGSSVWGPVMRYSEESSLAEMVVNAMVERGCDDAIYWADFGGGAYTEPEAICKAALLAILEQQTTDLAAERLVRQTLGDQGARGPGCG